MAKTRISVAPGDRYGPRTVVALMGMDKRRNRLVDMVCDRGHRAIMPLYVARREHKCGKCHNSGRPIKYEIVPGQRYGNRVVLGEAPYANTKHRMATVECDCGDIAVVEFHNLRRGQSQACAVCTRLIVHHGTVDAAKGFWKRKERELEQQRLSWARRVSEQRIAQENIVVARRNLARAMKAEGYKQKDIASMLGVTQPTVSYILRGLR